MPAMLVMYVIPVVMIPVAPLVSLVLFVAGSPHIALAFMAVATTIGIACWIQYRAGKTGMGQSTPRRALGLDPSYAEHKRYFAFSGTDTFRYFYSRSRYRDWFRGCFPVYFSRCRARI